MLFLLDGTSPQEPFPDPELAETDPDGLLAIGGDLAPERIVQAYRQGIFPWYDESQPILWWSPDPRMVLFPDELHLSRSLRKLLRQEKYGITFNQAFSQVIRACAEPRRHESGTWLTREMILAWEVLHDRGIAHSVEVWQEDELVGGLYGNALGAVFFGESMFSRQSNTSKLAFACLTHSLALAGFELIDCQVYTEHLASLGARPIPRKQFLSRLGALQREPVSFPRDVVCA
ncbi:leucyl/phenylalanyl-tRNA--protein transferase [Thiolapillus sp.]